MAKIKQTIPAGEIKYLKNTMIFPPDNLDQSQININTSNVHVHNSGNIK